MLQKIISSGLNSAARAALDVALHLDIAHGGWISKNDVSAQGRAASSYDLKELPKQPGLHGKVRHECRRHLAADPGGTDGELKTFRDFAQKNGLIFCTSTWSVFRLSKPRR